MSPVTRGGLARRGFRAAALGAVVAAIAAVGACSTARQDAIFAPDSGHPEGWVADHGGEYRKAAPRCAECHGADLTGGVSAVSCYDAGFDGFACHPAGPAAFIHPDGWGAPAAPGPSAKAPAGAMSGLAWCQGCHGRDFGGGGVNTPCASCHGVPAPHPRSPWRGGASTHVNASETGAGVCAQCHRQPGARGEPGCYNATLCHGPRGVHSGGWSDPGSHGAAAKRPPGRSDGFASCQVCHGGDFRGGESEVSCLSCHRASAPHSQAPWSGRYTHATTDGRNAGTCLPCHRSRRPPAGAEPGCFNNTLCHAHEPGWEASELHGAGAKARPSPTRGLAACQSCHGRLFDGGNPGGSCYRTGGCHTRPAPHPPGPWSGARTHATTREGNAEVCGLCHRRPSAPASLPDRCFNNSLCHPER